MPNKQLQDQHQIVRLPLYRATEGQIGSATSPDTGQTYINCFPNVTKNFITGDQEIMVTKRAPIKKSIRLSTHYSGTYQAGLAHQGICMLNDVMVCAIYDNTATHANIRIIQYRPAAQTSVLIGSISNANTTGGVDVTNTDEVFITEVEHASGGSIVPAIAITWKKAGSSYSDGFYALSSSGLFTAASLTKITAASFPVTLGKIITGPFQQLNGIFYVMGVDGVIYGSGGSGGTINDITAWDSNNTIRNRQFPDAGVGVFRYKHHIVGVNNSSVEFFNDVGNTVPASALGVTEQAFIKFGCQSAKQVINISDTLYWIGTSVDNTNGVFKLDGYTPVKISDENTDILLSLNESSASLYWINCLLMNGKQHLIINGVLNAHALSFDPGYSGSQNDSMSDPSFVADTYFGGTGLGLGNSCRLLCYSIEDKVWWRIQQSFSGISAMIPASWNSYSYRSNVNYTLYWSADTNVDAGSVYFIDQELSLGDWTDSDGKSSETLETYPIFIISPTVQFENMRRKKISKVLLAPVRYDKSSAVESCYLAAFTGVTANAIYDTSSNLVWSRCMAVGDEPIFQWTNLGMGRTWRFAIFFRTSGNIALQGLDLVVWQGVH